MPYCSQFSLFPNPPKVMDNPPCINSQYILFSLLLQIMTSFFKQAPNSFARMCLIKNSYLVQNEILFFLGIHSPYNRQLTSFISFKSRRSFGFFSYLKFTHFKEIGSFQTTKLLKIPNIIQK